MPTFPRVASAKPRLITMPKFSGAFESWGQSGKGQFRAYANIGRTWSEIYPVLNTTLPAVRALLAAINQGLREKTVWDVQHLYLLTRLGLGGGTVLVNGANQTGYNLNVDGGTASRTGWLKAGDIIKVTGCPVVFDVTADVNTNGSGQATIPLNPPIYAGQSPADNAAVSIDPAAFYFKAVLDVDNFPDIDTTKLMDAGLTINWREQPV